jgi:predicted signal transduction protein with EAL and GGDEF domain
MWYRLLDDFQLALITLLGACAVIDITPFAVCRFVIGDLLVGVIASANATILGRPGLFWAYPTFPSSHFLVDRRNATVATAAVLVMLGVRGEAFASMLQMVLFLDTAAIVSLFATVFAQRAESQRLQLETLATRDPLTGAPNRRAMEQELQIALERQRRDPRAVG